MLKNFCREGENNDILEKKLGKYLCKYVENRDWQLLSRWFMGYL